MANVLDGRADGPPVTAALAEFARACRFEDVPAAARREAARTLLNWVGGCVGGAGHPAVEAVFSGLRPFMGPASATVLGRAERVDALHAALLNGASCNVLDFDDAHLRTVIHPAGPVAPAVLALAEHRPPVSGAELLTALVVGVEVACKIGNGISPGHYRHGWHITGTCGVIGAAAACGRLLGLDGKRMRWALSTAATQAAGFRAMFGAMSRIVHSGRAAQNGLAAALMSEAGLESSERAIEAADGFANVISPTRDWTAMTDGLGTVWEIEANTYKPFAAGIVAQAAVDGCLRLRAAHGIAPDEVAAVEVAASPIAVTLADDPAPASANEARLSLQHAAAAALVHGRLGAAEMDDAAVARPETRALRGRVAVAADVALARDQARVRVRLSGGAAHECFVVHALGSMENPMSDAALDDKVRGLCAPALGAEAAEELIAVCRSAAGLPDAAAIAAAARPAVETGA